MSDTSPTLAAWRCVRGALLAAALALCPPAAGAQPTYLFSFGKARPASPTAFGASLTGLAVDSVTGDVYIPGPPIERFDAAGRYVGKIGSCRECFGMDVDLVSHDLYVADHGNSRVLQFTRDGVLVRTWGSAGSGNGQFESVYDVSVDSVGGHVFVIDRTRVQVFDREGDYLRSFGGLGTGWGKFSGGGGPFGVAFDPASRIVWTSDGDGHRIQAFDESGNFLRGWGDNGGGHEPGQIRWVRNIDVDAAGNVYEVDADNERIQVFSPQGVFLKQFRGPHNVEDGPFHPRGIAINRTTGDKWVAAAYAQRVDKFDAGDDYVFSIGDRPDPDSSTLLWPLDLAVSQVTGDVFVYTNGDYLVRRFSPTGTFLNRWGGCSRLDPWIDGQFGFDDDYLFARQFAPLAVDPEGMLWATSFPFHYKGDPFGNFARRFDPQGNFLLGWKPNQPLTQPYIESVYGVDVDPVAGRVYIADALIDEVRVHATDGTKLFGIPVPNPGGIAATGDGFYVAATGSNTIRHYDRDGHLLREWGGIGAGNGQFRLSPASGLAIDSRGHVYVADTNNDRIQVFDADGNFIETFGSSGTGPGQFRTPLQVGVVRASDTAYVLDSGNYRVEAFALDSGSDCADGLDNDGDGLVDLDDPGCASVSDGSERSASLPCDDGLDNDGDGYVDYPADPACTSESAAKEKRACQDGIDNDFDGTIDFDGGASVNGGTPLAPPDPDCKGNPAGLESPACGLGAELVLVVPLLALGARRRAAAGGPSVPSARAVTARAGGLRGTR